MLIATGKMNPEPAATYQPRCSRPLRRAVLSRRENARVDATVKIRPKHELTMQPGTRIKIRIRRRIAEVVCTSYSQIEETKCALAGLRWFVCGGRECGAGREGGKEGRKEGTSYGPAVINVIVQCCCSETYTTLPSPSQHQKHSVLQVCHAQRCPQIYSSHVAAPFIRSPL